MYTRLVKQGFSISEIAKKYGVTTTTIRYHLSRERNFKTCKGKKLYKTVAEREVFYSDLKLFKKEKFTQQYIADKYKVTQQTISYHAIQSHLSPWR